ncbi:hypothetical protein LPB72_11095 [Hydrogenophaga crassostreae]|uniref:SGNH hydrolase-type esterase domain-containing protein n=1 Tax=Hydrogenophaga crassostreae TaxID=1763535 RepID=A0A163CFG4_9BURK|nr:hypothetical protein LPB072_12475 [Hydrogenophaga crassostreae]OAD41838.1 hypothetical protein LPB72_11095 [Hydrogenophaga crassostreae]
MTAIATAALLTGCASSGSSTPTVSNPYSATGSSTLGEVQVNTMRVFGDSYSDPDYTSYLGSINWSEQLQASGLVSENLNYAIAGARASSGEVRSFDQQIDTALSGTAIADGDLTVVYLGHNDIGRTGSPDNLVNSSADYLTGINELIAAGAADENRRIFVTQIHDWSRNPGVADSTASQVTTWNTMIAGIANTHKNVIAVDMYTAFERIFTTPETYGFANVTTADSSRSSIDALYTDSTHFGSLGQKVITRVYQHYLTRGWDWANSVSAGTDSAAQLNADIDDGTLVLSSSFGNTTGQSLQYGFRLLPMGVKDTNALSQSSAQTSQVFRPFSEQTAFSQSTPSGLALDFGLGTSDKPGDARIGVALLQYQQATDLTSAQEHQSRQYTSSALSAYLHQPLAGGMFSAQVSHLKLDFTNQSQDDLVNLNLTNENTGDTWSMVNKLRYPMRSGGLSITPWVSLTGQTHNLDAAQFSSLYTSDVKYSSSRMNELLSGLGVDIQSSPIFLDRGAKVQFGGSLNHISSLYRDAITVSMEESNTAGFVQSEVFQSEKINATLLSLQANVLLNKQVRISATYGAKLQDVKDTSSLAVLAHFSY